MVQLCANAYLSTSLCSMLFQMLFPDVQPCSSSHLVNIKFQVSVTSSRGLPSPTQTLNRWQSIAVVVLYQLPCLWMLTEYKTHTRALYGMFNSNYSLKLDLQTVGSCWMWYWEQNSSPLQEQQSLLPTEPFLYTPDMHLLVYTRTKPTALEKDKQILIPGLLPDRVQGQCG